MARTKTRSSRAAGRVVVIGASAGGFRALGNLAAQLPRRFPGAVFMVLHVPPDFDSDILLRMLRGRTTLECKLAQDGEHYRAGVIYVAPPDVHMLVKEQTILITKGARENRYRPAIDPLFRSAAVAHGTRVIGVVLTGMLDDGTAGLEAIERCGGVTVVQEPSDAAFAQMPQSAIDHVRVHHRVELASMGALLERLVHERPSKRKRTPPDVVTEAIIAERVVSDVHAAHALGAQVPYNCPQCGGVLWQMSQPKVSRYRCHTGHAFTAAALLAAQTEKIEETLWVTLRMLEERRNLFHAMKGRGSRAASPSAVERARETEVHIARLREILGTGPGQPVPRTSARRSRPPPPTSLATRGPEPGAPPARRRRSCAARPWLSPWLPRCGQRKTVISTGAALAAPPANGSTPGGGHGNPERLYP